MRISFRSVGVESEDDPPARKRPAAWHETAVKKYKAAPGKRDDDSDKNDGDIDERINYEIFVQRM